MATQERPRNQDAAAPRLRTLLLLAILATLRCGDDGIGPKVSVTVTGFTSEIVTSLVRVSLDGQDSRSTFDPLRQNIDRFELQLQPDLKGALGIHVSGQGSDGCTAQAGDTKLQIEGNGSYSAEVAVAAELGCQLVVRKVGDGSGQVALSDGTSWTFDVPAPPQASCPLESLVGASKQKSFPVGTKLKVETQVTESSAPGSYISNMRGCNENVRGCEVTITPDTRVVEVEIGRNRVCSPQQVCWEHPRPQGMPLRRVLGRNSNDIWAVGDGTMLHWEGSFWSSPRWPQATQRLAGLVMGGSQFIVAVGDSGKIERLTNNVWACPEAVGNVNLRDAWGLNTSDFWAVGSQGAVMHWDGTSWSSAAISGISSIELQGISGRSAQDIWVVGEQGTVLHYDGTSWGKVAFPTTDNLYGVWADPSGTTWVVGDRGVSASIKGAQVTLLATSSSVRLRAIFGIGPKERWAVGDAGTLLRLESNTWSQVESGTRQNLHSLWGDRSTDLWAVGEGGTQLHYNGVFWTLNSDSRTTRSLYGISGVTTNQPGILAPIYAVGEQGTVLRYTGADWITDPALGNVILRNLRAVSTISPTEVWIAGDSGTILRWDGSQVLLPVTGTAADLLALWTQQGSVLAVGTGGVLARWNGASWSSAALAAAAGKTLRAAWGTSLSNVWLAGDGGLLLRWNGAAASPVLSGVTDSLNGLWGSSAADVWAVGNGGRILHFDGNAWSVHAQGSGLTPSHLRAITGSGPSEIYCAGDAGTLLRFDGKAWSIVNSGTVGTLQAMWSGRTEELLLAGQNAAILRYYTRVTTQ
jgi:hypothetical protein